MGAITQNGQAIDVETVTFENDCIYFFQVEVNPMSLVKYVVYLKSQPGLKQPKKIDFANASGNSYKHGDVAITLQSSGLLDTIS